jgi:hypothetical protein
MILVTGRARPHGDLAGAETKLKDANQRGPHWADPLKAWGDDEAFKYAPNWKQLKEAREALVRQRGSVDCRDADESGRIKAPCQASPYLHTWPGA